MLVEGREGEGEGAGVGVRGIGGEKVNADFKL